MFVKDAVVEVFENVYCIQGPSVPTIAIPPPQLFRGIRAVVFYKSVFFFLRSTVKDLIDGSTPPKCSSTPLATTPVPVPVQGPPAPAPSSQQQHPARHPSEQEEEPLSLCVDNRNDGVSMAAMGGGGGAAGANKRAYSRLNGPHSDERRDEHQEDEEEEEDEQEQVGSPRPPLSQLFVLEFVEI